MTSAPRLDDLEVWVADADPAAARVRAVLPGKPETFGALKLTGQIVGPRCDFSRTLPARIPLVSRDNPEGLAAEAIIPDPCFWTPDLPFLYDVHLDVVREGTSERAAERILGISALRPHRQRLILESRNFILRGVRREAVRETDIDAWREVGAAMVVTNPPDDLCDAASRRGVLILARVSADLPVTLRRLARWPAVGIILIDDVAAAAPSAGAQLRALVPGKLLAAPLPPDPAISPPAWAHVALMGADALLKSVRRADSFPLPVIASRDLPSATALQEARAACDALQRDLSPLGLFAGYAV